MFSRKTIFLKLPTGVLKYRDYGSFDENTLLQEISKLPKTVMIRYWYFKVPKYVIDISTSWSQSYEDKIISVENEKAVYKNEDTAKLFKSKSGALMDSSKIELFQMK